MALTQGGGDAESHERYKLKTIFEKKVSISFLDTKTFDENSSQVWKEILSRWGQADYDDLTKRKEHQDALKIEYDAQEWAKNRRGDYPIIGDQLDMIYKDNLNSTTTHKDAVEAVKTKWPKDNSGPVE